MILINFKKPPKPFALKLACRRNGFFVRFFKLTLSENPDLFIQIGVDTHALIGECFNTSFNSRQYTATLATSTASSGEWALMMVGPMETMSMSG